MKTPSKKNAKSKRTPHQVRIIGGQWKRSLLAVVDAEGLRPTPDRVRETAFNWLNHLCDGEWARLNCLDLFAGSGALGFEAASRGAKHVTLVEAHTPAYRQLEVSKQKLHASHVSLLRGDALSFAKGVVTQQQFDVIFLDPPFGHDWLPKILPLCLTLLKDDGYLYVEAESALDQSEADENTANWLHGWQVIRVGKAGSVFFHVLQRSISKHEAHENQA